MPDNLYGILDISSEASASEIKKAYIKKIREFPNQEFPDEFRQIRKAYEILIDSDSRQEYDSMEKHGPEIKQLENQASKALEEDDFDTAIASYKRILMIEPTLHIIRNQMAITLSKKGEYDKALLQFERLIKVHPENALYHCNLGYAYENVGMVAMAIESFKNAQKVSPNDADYTFALVDFYVRMKEFNSAKASLEAVLGNKQEEGFHQFLYLFYLIKVNLYEHNPQGIEHALARVEQLLQEHQDEKGYVATEFAKLAYELNEEKLYVLSKKLTERAIQLDPDNQIIQELNEQTKENDLLFGEYTLLEKDEAVLKPIKHKLFLYLYGDDLEDIEQEESFETMFDNVEFIATYQSEETIKSIKRIIIKYPNLYETQEEFFGKVMKQAKNSFETEENYEVLKMDSQVTNSIKRLVALYITHLTEEDREYYFNDIMDEMAEEPVYKLLHSIKRLESTYPKLFNLNSSFFLDIKKKLTEATEARNMNNSYTETQSSSSSYHASNSNSCFVATAAYGSPMVKELDYLRFWRDQYLKKSLFGKCFIRFYYKVGPYLARVVDNSTLLKRIVRSSVNSILTQLDTKYKLKAQVNEVIKQGGTASKNNL